MAIEVTHENYLRYKKIADGIDGKLRRIREASTFSSNPKAWQDHFEFRQLIEMGDRIIPYLIYHATRTGFDWVHLDLISILSGEDIVLPGNEGKFYHQIADYMLWFVDSKYDKHDFYHGLLDEAPESQV